MNALLPFVTALGFSGTWGRFRSRKTDAVRNDATKPKCLELPVISISGPTTASDGIEFEDAPGAVAWNAPNPPGGHSEFLGVHANRNRRMFPNTSHSCGMSRSRRSFRSGRGLPEHHRPFRSLLNRTPRQHQPMFAGMGSISDRHTLDRLRVYPEMSVSLRYRVVMVTGSYQIQRVIGLSG